MFARDASHRVLMRCGVVKELTETVVALSQIKGGNVTLSQKAAWQPITVTFQGIEVCVILFFVKQLLSNLKV